MNFIFTFMLVFTLSIIIQVFIRKLIERYSIILQFRMKLQKEIDLLVSMDRLSLAQAYKKYLSKNSTFIMWLSGYSIKQLENQLIGIKLTTKKK